MSHLLPPRNLSANSGLWRYYLYDREIQMADHSEASRLIRAQALMSDLSGRGRDPEIAAIALLVQRTLDGDRAAFQQVVLRYDRRVMQLAKRLMGTVEDAEEAMQEVFLRAFRFLHRFDPERPFEPWLVRLTVNVCRDLARKRGTRDRTFSEMRDSDREASDGAGDPHADLVDHQRRRDLWKALDRLPPRERTAIVLRDLEGYSTAEVASILKLSESTVRSQISRARLRIRNAIERMGRSER